MLGENREVPQQVIDKTVSFEHEKQSFKALNKWNDEAAENSLWTLNAPEPHFSAW